MKTKPTKTNIPTKKEAQKLIKLAEGEIKVWEKFIDDLKLFANPKKINIKINI